MKARVDVSKFDRADHGEIILTYFACMTFAELLYFTSYVCFGHWSNLQKYSMCLTVFACSLTGACFGKIITKVKIDVLSP